MSSFILVSYLFSCLVNVELTRFSRKSTDSNPLSLPIFSRLFSTLSFSHTLSNRSITSRLLLHLVSFLNLRFLVSVDPHSSLSHVFLFRSSILSFPFLYVAYLILSTRISFFFHSRSRSFLMCRNETKRNKSCTKFSRLVRAQSREKRIRYIVTRSSWSS